MRAAQLISLALAIACLGTTQADSAASFSATINSVQPKIVKVYGVGGLRGLEAYQSGFLISENGYILTVWSTVLDTEFITITLDDGRRFEEATFVGADPRLEIAVLKIEASELPHFDLGAAASGQVGNRVLAFSNLYKVATGSEPASVQHGVVSALAKLTARRGIFKTPYNGPVLVLDAMTNNPGAAGGAVTNQRGALLGMIGKELRNAQDNTWLNYAVPIGELRESITAIIENKSPPRGSDTENLPKNSIDLVALGAVLVPEVVDSTPPYIDAVRPGSSAETAGLLRDDLVLFVGSVLVQSLDDLASECRRIDSRRPLQLTVRRGDELKAIVIEPSKTGDGN
jgi:serine protease Do